MYFYRYLGAFPTILRLPDGSAFFLRYGEEFSSQLDFVHPLVIKIEEKGLAHE